MAMQLRKKVQNFLTDNQEGRFEAKEIAKYIFDNFRPDCDEKRRNSKRPNMSDNKLLQQITGEIHANKACIENVSYDEVSGVRKFFYDESPSDDADVNVDDAKVEKGNRKEKDLHPVLHRYVSAELNVSSKDINHRKRKGKKERGKDNDWRFPDVVGMQRLDYDWDRDMKGYAPAISHFSCLGIVKLFSFELKRELTSNFRHCYAQAVINSSWANVGYLVAEKVDKRCLVELRTMASMHGIGVIQLNFDDPIEKTKILIPAKEKSDINWSSVDKLYRENKDFKDYVEAVVNYCNSTNKKLTDIWDYTDGLDEGQ